MIILWSLFRCFGILDGGDTIVGLIDSRRCIAKGQHDDFISVWTGKGYLSRLAGRDPSNTIDESVSINNNVDNRLNHVRIEDLLLYYSCKKLSNNDIDNVNSTNIKYDPDEYFRLRHQLERESFIKCNHEFRAYRLAIGNNDYGLKIIYIDTKHNLAPSRRTQSFNQVVVDIINDINTHVNSDNVNNNTNVINFVYSDLTKDMLYSCMCCQGIYHRSNSKNSYNYKLINDNDDISIFGKLCSNGDGMFWLNDQTQLICVEIDENDSKCRYTSNINSNRITVDDTLICNYRVTNTSNASIIHDLTRQIKNINGHLMKSILNMFTVQHILGSRRIMNVHLNGEHVCDISVA